MAALEFRLECGTGALFELSSDLALFDDGAGDPQSHQGYAHDHAQRGELPFGHSVRRLSPTAARPAAFGLFNAPKRTL